MEFFPLCPGDSFSTSRIFSGNWVVKGFGFFFGPVLGLERVCSTLLVFTLFVLFSFGSFGFQDWGCLIILGTSLGIWFPGGSRNIFCSAGRWTTHGFLGSFDFHVFSFDLQQLFRVCICIGSHQSVIARGEGERQQSPRASISSFLALSLWASSLPHFSFFPMKIWIGPLVGSLLSRGVVVFLIRLVRETLSLGLDLVFCFFLSLIFCPRCPVRSWTSMSRSLGSLEPGRRGESPACSLFLTLGESFWSVFFWLRGLIRSFSHLPFSRMGGVPC